MTLTIVVSSIIYAIGNLLLISTANVDVRMNIIKYLNDIEPLMNGEQMRNGQIYGRFRPAFEALVQFLSGTAPKNLISFARECGSLIVNAFDSAEPNEDNAQQFCHVLHAMTTGYTRGITIFPNTDYKNMYCGTIDADGNVQFMFHLRGSPTLDLKLQHLAWYAIIKRLKDAGCEIFASMSLNKLMNDCLSLDASYKLCEFLGVTKKIMAAKIAVKIAREKQIKAGIFASENGIAALMNENFESPLVTEFLALNNDFIAAENLAKQMIASCMTPTWPNNTA